MGETVEYTPGVKDGNPVALKIRGDAVITCEHACYQSMPSWSQSDSGNNSDAVGSSSNLEDPSKMGTLERRPSRSRMRDQFEPFQGSKPCPSPRRSRDSRNPFFTR